MNRKIERALGAFTRTDRIGLTLMRLAIAIVFLWIGGLKFAPYEADSITPFVANSPVMSFFYEHPQAYKEHMTHEGALVPVQRAWQTENQTYSFSRGLGMVELTIGLLVLSYPISKRLGLRPRRFAVCRARRCPVCRWDALFKQKGLVPIPRQSITTIEPSEAQQR